MTEDQFRAAGTYDGRRVDLYQWVAERQGVEVYDDGTIHPSESWAHLVDDQGESITVGGFGHEDLCRFAAEVSIPVYWTRDVGLPQRMRDYTNRSKGRPE